MRTWSFERFGVVKQLATDDRLIMCDYDRRRDFPRVQVMRALCNRLGLRMLWFRQDRTRRGFHLLARFADALSPMEAIAIQLLFGSDPNREGLNFMRARSLAVFPSSFWQSRWNLLFERKIL